MRSYLCISDHILITPAMGFAILFLTTPHNREVSIKSLDFSLPLRFVRPCMDEGDGQ
jgi:hypothetical protein